MLGGVTLQFVVSLCTHAVLVGLIYKHGRIHRHAQRQSAFSVHPTASVHAQTDDLETLSALTVPSRPQPSGEPAHVHVVRRRLRQLMKRPKWTTRR